jgi:hypothetical protein
MKIEHAIFEDGGSFYADFENEELSIPEIPWEEGDMVIFESRGSKFRGTLQNTLMGKKIFQVANLKKIA